MKKLPLEYTARERWTVILVLGGIVVSFIAVESYPVVSDIYRSWKESRERAEFEEKRWKQHGIDAVAVVVSTEIREGTHRYRTRRSARGGRVIEKPSRYQVATIEFDGFTATGFMGSYSSVEADGSLKHHSGYDYRVGQQVQVRYIRKDDGSVTVKRLGADPATWPTAMVTGQRKP